MEKVSNEVGLLIFGNFQDPVCWVEQNQRHLPKAMGEIAFVRRSKIHPHCHLQVLMLLECY